MFRANVYVKTRSPPLDVDLAFNAPRENDRVEERGGFFHVVAKSQLTTATPMDILSVCGAKVIRFNPGGKDSSSFSVSYGSPRGPPSRLV